MNLHSSPSVIPIDPLARQLAGTFEAAGEELYLVGGAVRDALLGHRDTDLDFATSAPPEKTLQILQALDLATPYRVGEKFGTIGLPRAGRLIEITTYRAEESYPIGSRKPIVRFGRTLMEDLTRRDFTINAMAASPTTGELIDSLGGAQDLASRIVRAVGNSTERFREDPLRLLRAVRFASRLDFTIEPNTWAAMLQLASALGQISRERIRDEYTHMLVGPAPAIALTLLRDSGLLGSSVPTLLQLDAMPDHGPFHPLSLWDHTMLVVSAVPPQLPVRWAAILHDIAKPATRTYEPNGRPRFFHHEEVGARIARDALTSLRYSNNEIDTVTLLVETHMQLHAYSAEWTDGAVRRLMLRLGPALQQALALARADGAGHSLTGEAANAPKFDELETRIGRLGQHDVARIASPISGNDLMERYGKAPGPWIRVLKNAICDAIIEGELSPGDRDGAWEIADRLVKTA